MSEPFAMPHPSVAQDHIVIHAPSGASAAELAMPGDKSISQRAALLCGLARGGSVVRNFLVSEDALHTLGAMTAMGAQAEVDGDSLRIQGVGLRPHAPAADIDCGNSGTGMRLLSGLVAGQPFRTVLTGDASLRSRTMERIREPLVKMGAKVVLRGEGGRAPIEIEGGGLRGIDYVMPVASAQVKSCVLLAGLFAEGPTTVTELRPTRDHTERMLQYFGHPVEVQGARVTVRRAATPWDGAEFAVPGDFSSAAFWMVAAAVREGSRVVLPSVGLNPRRIALLDVLGRMGARVRITPDPAEGQVEETARIEVTGQGLRGTAIAGDEIPNLIDELPILAVAGALAEGRTEIRDAQELRHKESDRIAVMVGNLRALGVEARETEDGMVIEGPTSLRPARPCASRGDHRVAMSMAILACSCPAPVRIEGIACTRTSYPAFWDHLRTWGARLETD